MYTHTVIAEVEAVNKELYDYLNLVIMTRCVCVYLYIYMMCIYSYTNWVIAEVVQGGEDS